MRSTNIRKKSTHEIQVLLEKTNMEFDLVVNEALNSYLPTIFISCPFTGELCTKSQCMECESAKLPETALAPARKDLKKRAH
jgi:hypothetical protein